MKRFRDQMLAGGFVSLSLLASGCGGPEGESPVAVPDSVREQIDEAKATTTDSVDKAKEVVAEGAEKAKEAVTEGAEKAKEVVAAGVAKAREAIEKIELPKLPEVDSLKGELTKFVGTVTEAFESAKDSATAEAAAAKIKELSGQLDPLKEALSKVPDTAKELVDKYIVANLKYLKEYASKVLTDSGVKEKLQPAVDELMAKISELTK